MNLADFAHMTSVDSRCSDIGNHDYSWARELDTNPTAALCGGEPCYRSGLLAIRCHAARDNCKPSRFGWVVCAAAFSLLHVGGYPCHEDINASPADDFFTYSTPADPEMMPWRCSQPAALRELAAALTPNENPCIFEPAGDREAWWCEPKTGSYGVQMMTLGFSIGKAGGQWRKRERDVTASVLAALTGFGLHAEIDQDHGWIVLTDHKRPYRC